MGLQTAACRSVTSHKAVLFIALLLTDTKLHTWKTHQCSLTRIILSESLRINSTVQTPPSWLTFKILSRPQCKAEKPLCKVYQAGKMSGLTSDLASMICDTSSGRSLNSLFRVLLRRLWGCDRSLFLAPASNTILSLIGWRKGIALPCCIALLRMKCCN